MAMELPTVRDLSRRSNEEVPARFCMLSLEDFLERDSWITWEHELRRAQHEWDKVQACLGMRLPPQL